MICPHCGIGTSPLFRPAAIGNAHGIPFHTQTGNCSECGDLIVMGVWVVGGEESSEILLFPTGPRSRPIPPEVTGEYAQDFREASIVLEFSPKASAALSRRLVQHILREKAGITKRNLDEEIEEVIAQGHLPPDLADDLDMIRTVGNFAAHPIKSTSTGEVVEVEPGEAEGLLDVLEELLDYYFVRPARRAEKRAKLDAKLTEAGKPPLKTSAASPPAAPPIAS